MQTDDDSEEPPDPRELGEETARLFVEARSGSSDALGALLEKCRACLSTIASRQGPQKRGISGSDIVQETMLRAMSRFPDFRGNTKPALLAWMKQILVRLLIDQHRAGKAAKRAAGKEIPIDPDKLDRSPSNNLDPGDLATLRENEHRLESALRFISDECRQAIVLRFWGGFKWKEVGLLLDKTEDGARMVWYRGVDELRRCFDQMD